jgi:ubiquinone/menaquinone biosynthesis C-methylase UbiE
MLDIHYTNLYNGEINHWWYRIRREMVNNIFKRYIQKKNLKILDVGCGTGALMKELGSYGEVYGLDFSEKAIEFCKVRGEKNLTFGSITAIPFEDNFFDVVVSLDVIEHVEDDALALSEIRRVLKKDGYSIIFVPAFMFLWGKSDELSCHFRRYTLKDLKSKVCRGGLNIVRSTYFNTFLFLPILFVRLIVRLLKIKIKNENEMGSGGLVNWLLYVIFHIESLLLRHMSFPFGVSALVVSRKK